MALKDGRRVELVIVLLTEVALVVCAVEDCLLHTFAILSKFVSKLSLAGFAEGQTRLCSARLDLDVDFVDQANVFLREDAIRVG